MSEKSPNVRWHSSRIDVEARRRAADHWSGLLWLTGLSGSGKSTLAEELQYQLFREGRRVYLLDGDNIRHGLNGDLGFGPADRAENIRRIGEVARLFVDAGVIVITAFISPFERDRHVVRQLFAPQDFIEVHVDCDLEQCEARDPKGLYKRARSGELKEFTGVDSPYEIPSNPELKLTTNTESIEACVSILRREVERRDSAWKETRSFKDND